MDIYQQHGYSSRKDYLENLADEFGTDYYTVKVLADMLGPNEDFDGLISALKDRGEFL